MKIQEGCDYACSYCIIPSVRGKSRSISEETLIKQVQILADNGYTEFVLTGTNIGSYGRKDGTSLGRLLQRLGAVNGVKRIRLGSLEPAQIDESFKEILDELWIERHLHIALQHTSEKMLRLMRRRSHTKDDLALFELLRGKGYALGTDFIVAHPGRKRGNLGGSIRKFQKICAHAFARLCFFAKKRHALGYAFSAKSANKRFARQRTLANAQKHSGAKQP